MFSVLSYLDSLLDPSLSQSEHLMLSI